MYLYRWLMQLKLTYGITNIHFLIPTIYKGYWYKLFYYRRRSSILYSYMLNTILNYLSIFSTYRLQNIIIYYTYCNLYKQIVNNMYFFSNLYIYTYITNYSAIQIASAYWIPGKTFCKHASHFLFILLISGTTGTLYQKWE